MQLFLEALSQDKGTDDRAMSYGFFLFICGPSATSVRATTEQPKAEIDETIAGLHVTPHMSELQLVGRLVHLDTCPLHLLQQKLTKAFIGQHFGSPWFIGFIITVNFMAAMLIALRAILASLVCLGVIRFLNSKEQIQDHLEEQI